MRSLVRTFRQRTQALLESPTGSGKSLAILAASLSWLRYQKIHGLPPSTPLVRVIPGPRPADAGPQPSLSASPNDSEFARPRLQVVKPLAPPHPPAVLPDVAKAAPASLLIIASRTHAQLDQLTSELEKLKRLGGPYRTIRAVHLASRQHVSLPLRARYLTLACCSSAPFLECARLLTPSVPALLPVSPPLLARTWGRSSSLPKRSLSDSKTVAVSVRWLSSWIRLRDAMRVDFTARELWFVKTRTLSWCPTSTCWILACAQLPGCR